MTTPTPAYCDPATGLCTPTTIEDAPVQSVSLQEGVEIVYVGDPMCSWCWGISPTINQLAAAAAANGITFTTLVGGLRPGGGDEWNQEFADFLRHHWEEVSARSGQPFNYGLLDAPAFNYDTEPACRAVVAARQMNPAAERRFFELVQHHFYVQNNDPAQLSFYQPICAELGLDFEAFVRLFSSAEIIEATRAEFQLHRNWGVRGYPTVLFRQDNQLTVIARGFSSFDQLWAAVSDLSQQ
ncbi:MAG: DsbA family protein [Bacteroidota bacterium]